MSFVINIVLLVFLLIMALAVLKTTHLFAMAMMFSLYSLLVAGLFVVLDAPDVAFTEAAVGTGISTVLMLVTLASIKDGHEAPGTSKKRLGPLIICVVMGGLLIFGTHDIAKLGDIQSAPNQQVALRYIEQGQAETGVPNLVTAVLASYRGFDTLGEVTVVLTAGIGVLMLLGPRRKIRIKTRGANKNDK
ncbi:MAG: multicomponent Na+:H+ antiporter subunit B [Alphaproteobacteria bacterium]|jgi:multicomponent Na+:H+ antiporter subunit B